MSKQRNYSLTDDEKLALLNYSLDKTVEDVFLLNEAMNKKLRLEFAEKTHQEFMLDEIDEMLGFGSLLAKKGDAER